MRSIFGVNEADNPHVAHAVASTERIAAKPMRQIREATSKEYDVSDRGATKEVPIGLGAIATHRRKRRQQRPEPPLPEPPRAP